MNKIGLKASWKEGYDEQSLDKNDPWRWGFAAPAHENGVAVSGGWGMIGAPPENRPVVAGSGAPDLFGEAENELMCPAS
uniref:Uncharacterized protein n=1 Tax=Desulfatirhabdium butyrativorans TaxID=340467 RepID=A0A7C4RUS8_9BACT